MTKYAKLPDGQVLDFPDDLDDNEMHRQVKQHMGIPIPPTPEEAARAEDMQMAGGRNQALIALAQQVAQMNAGINAMCRDARTTQQLLQQVAQSIDRLDKTITASARLVFRGVTATVTQEVERDGKGKISKTTLTKEVRQ